MKCDDIGSIIVAGPAYTHFGGDSREVQVVGFLGMEDICPAL